MDLSGLSAVDTAAELVAWLNENLVSPVRPVITGPDLGSIINKAIAILENPEFSAIAGSPSDNAALIAALNAKQNSLGFTPEDTANKNTANGYAGLDGSGKVAAAQLPSYVDDVLEYANYAALPGTGESGKIYVTLDDNKEYRWSGSVYVQIVASPGSTDAVSEGTTNLYFTAARVLAAILTGIGFGTAEAVIATDTILTGIGKLQAQITILFNRVLPSGGTTGKILSKLSDDDFDVDWIDNSFGNISGDVTDNANLVTALSGKVDKVTGKSLIADSEISRLAGVSNLFDGTFTSLSALQAAFPTSSDGHEALVDAGAGSNAIKYIWDMQDGWIQGGGSGASSFADLTGSPSDNAALSSALSAKEPTITAGSSSQYLKGDKSLGTFLTDVMACLLTGISFSTSSAIVSTDNLKAALGKLQAQITGIVANLIPTVSSGEKVVTQKSTGTHVDYDAVTQYLADINDSAGDKTSSDLNTAYPSAVIGQKVWGTNNLYEKKTTLTWSKIPYTIA